MESETEEKTDLRLFQFFCGLLLLFLCATKLSSNRLLSINPKLSTKTLNKAFSKIFLPQTEHRSWRGKQESSLTSAHMHWRVPRYLPTHLDQTRFDFIWHRRGILVIFSYTSIPPFSYLPHYLSKITTSHWVAFEREGVWSNGSQQMAILRLIEDAQRLTPSCLLLPD